MTRLHDALEAVFAVLAWPSPIWSVIANTSMLVPTLIASRHFARWAAFTGRKQVWGEMPRTRIVGATATGSSAAGQAERGD